MSYVDGFVIPVPIKNLAAYRRMSQKAGKFGVNGALAYRNGGGDSRSKLRLSAERKLKPGRRCFDGF